MAGRPRRSGEGVELDRGEEIQQSSVFLPVFTPHLHASNIALISPSLSPILSSGPGEKLSLFSFIPHSICPRSQGRHAPLILLFVIQASIMHKLVNLAVQRGMTWNPVERPVWRYIQGGDNGRLNTRLSDCPVSHSRSCVTRPRNHIITHIWEKPSQWLKCHKTPPWCIFTSAYSSCCCFCWAPSLVRLWWSCLQDFSRLHLSQQPVENQHYLQLRSTPRRMAVKALLIFYYCGTKYLAFELYWIYISYPKSWLLGSLNETVREGETTPASAVFSSLSIYPGDFLLSSESNCTFSVRRNE